MSEAKSAEYKNQIAEKGPDTMGIWETLSVVKKMLFDANDRAPKQRLPEVKPDLPSFITASDELKFIWFGHSTLLLNLDSQLIMIDPVFSGSASPFDFMVKRFQPPVLQLEELPNLDTILISHDHYDHLDEKTIKFFKNRTVKFIVPVGVGKHLVDWGIPKNRITELSWNESARVKDITFTAAPAQHFSGRGLFDRNETLWASWIVQGKTEKIYYSGDSGYGPHFKEIGKQHGPFNYAFIENGQYNERWPDVHMQPEEGLQAMIDINAHTIIPVHWGMFDLSLHHWSEPVVRMHKIATAWHIPMITPRLGEVVETQNYKSRPWWEGIIQSAEQSLQTKQANQGRDVPLQLELATK